MTNDELNKLKELAKRATPGPWKFEDGMQAGPSDQVVWSPTQNTGYNEEDEPCNVICTMPNDSYGYACALYDNGAYIAAVSPDVVLKLIDQLAEAREVLEEYSGPNKMSETHGTLLNRFERWRTAARAYLEKYK